MPRSASAATSAGESRRARIAACTCGWSVFTRPPASSSNPVHCSSGVASTPACARCAAVPPDATMRAPWAISARANSAAPRLSESESSATRGQPITPSRLILSSVPLASPLACQASRRGPGDPPPRLEIALLRALHDLGRQRRRGRLVVPSAVIEPVAHHLLVERDQLPGLVLGAVPVARRIGRERFVDQRERAIHSSKLELG